ncbi:MAG: hypothetical protein WBV10_14270 [Exiguobacterium marinum]|uniref:hypothetical protein n=1 Tax=Exiguobacterium marinum TaxID=273528 RepID=UPI003C39AAEA
MSHEKPLIDSVSADYLVRIVNRVAASFDVAGLSAEEVVVIQALLERFDNALWHEHEKMMLGAYRDVLEHPEKYEGDEDEDDEPDDDDSEGSSGPPH